MRSVHLIARFRAWLRDVLRPYEPDVRHALARHVRRGMTVADVGANRGYFSLYLARLVGRGGRVVVVEALPENVELIRRRARLRLLGRRVEVIHAAAADSSGEVELYPGREGNPGEWSLDEAFAARSDSGPAGRRSLLVPSVTLDECLRGRNVSVIKIDVEGAEERVVAGMARLLAEEQPLVVLERHGDAGHRAIAALAAAGYRIQSPDGEPLDADTSVFHVVAIR